MSSDAKSRMARVLAGSPAAFDSLGLQTPPEVTQAILAMLVPPLGAGSKAFMQAPEALAPQADSMFPAAMQGARAAESSLPEMAPGSKTGDPHALYAYHDNFGEGGSPRAIYNVFGDPNNPILKKAGWGSSLPKEVIDQFGIPVIGKQIAKAASGFFK